jgi:hypothetical protein
MAVGNEQVESKQSHANRDDIGRRKRRSGDRTTAEN